MKNAHTLILFVFGLLCVDAFSQTSIENKTVEIQLRAVDSLHAAAVLSGDLQAMDKYWTEDFMVTNPFNEIDQANRIRSGALKYQSFQRIAEAVKIHGETGIVMGREIVMPDHQSAGAGQTIHRRYTNIWMKRDGAWRLVARHANVICAKL